MTVARPRLKVQVEGQGQGLVLRLKLPRMEIRSARPLSSNRGSLFSGLLAEQHFRGVARPDFQGCSL